MTVEGSSGAQAGPSAFQSKDMIVTFILTDGRTTARTLTVDMSRQAQE